MEKLIVVYCTTPDEECAKEIAQALVENQLAACVSVLPPIASTYRWEGKVENAKEILLMIKTKLSSFEKLKDQIVSIHPYEVPEIIATPIIEGLPAYMDWVVKETSV